MGVVKVLPFQKIFKRIFLLNGVKFENFKLMKVF